MNTDFEDQYLDVLQNIEWGLLSDVSAHPELCDHDMLRVIEYTIAYYKIKDKDTFLVQRKLSPLLQKIFEKVSSLCDWRLGKCSMPKQQLTCDPISIDELLQCLKRIEKSIKFWTREGGRRGYITFAAPRALV